MSQVGQTVFQGRGGVVNARIRGFHLSIYNLSIYVLSVLSVQMELTGRPLVHACLNIRLFIIYKFFKHTQIPFSNYLVVVFHSWKAFHVMKCYSYYLCNCKLGNLCKYLAQGVD